MAARASKGRGMRAVYDKEGVDPGQCPEHHTPHFHQRRRRPRGRLHNRTGEDACTRCRDRNLKRIATPSVARDGPRRAAVVAVTNGRLDFGNWERIFQGQAEWLARES
jgi:hypothetical protein